MPDVGRDIVRTLVNMYKDGGDLPRWPIANVYSGCMIGTHSNELVLDAVVKGITDFDIESAFEGMWLQATDPNRPHIGREGLTEYVNLGFVPREKYNKAASLTLEYAFDDWAASTLAEILGYTAEAALLANRSQNYRNVWNASVAYMCPRSSNLVRFVCRYRS
jgi:putative alpha-1,2-mannosidase